MSQRTKPLKRQIVAALLNPAVEWTFHCPGELLHPPYFQHGKLTVNRRGIVEYDGARVRFLFHFCFRKAYRRRLRLLAAAELS